MFCHPSQEVNAPRGSYSWLSIWNLLWHELVSSWHFWARINNYLFRIGDTHHRIVQVIPVSWMPREEPYPRDILHTIFGEHLVNSITCSPRHGVEVPDVVPSEVIG